MESKACLCSQMISEGGEFLKSAMENVFAKTDDHNRELSCGVVAIIGSQNSGKSTLLNRTFNCNFQELDKRKGSKQTTKGVWIAIANTVDPIVILDIEGSDGRERGENGTLFEKQTALLAMATAHVIMINMWCTDVGRLKASGMDTLRVVFEAMVQQFESRKSTILFIIRDYDPEDDSPLDHLNDTLKSGVRKIWDDVSNGPASKPGHELPNIEITTLPHLRHNKPEFQKQVDGLRRKLCDLINTSDHKCRLSDFSFRVEVIWEQIKTNQKLDIPQVKVMLAKFRCDKITDELRKQFVTNKDWVRLKDGIKLGVISGFCRNFWEILQNIDSQYESETKTYDADTVTVERKNMISRLLQDAYPVYQEMLESLYKCCDVNFKNALGELSSLSEFAANINNHQNRWLVMFDNECGDAKLIQLSGEWNGLNLRSKLAVEIDTYSVETRNSLILAVVKKIEKNMRTALNVDVGSLLRDGSYGQTWQVIRQLLEDEYTKADKTLSEEINKSGIKIEGTDRILEEMKQKLRSDGRQAVLDTAKEEAKPNRVIDNMVNRYQRSILLEKNNNSNNDDDPVKICAEASYDFHGVLCANLVMRLNGEAAHDTKNIDDALIETLKKLIISPTTNIPGHWPGVPAECTVITPPAECINTWAKAVERINENIIKPAVELKNKDLELQIRIKRDQISSAEGGFWEVFKMRSEHIIVATFNVLAGVGRLVIGDLSGIDFVCSGFEVIWNVRTAFPGTDQLPLEYKKLEALESARISDSGQVFFKANDLNLTTESFRQITSE